MTGVRTLGREMGLKSECSKDGWGFTADEHSKGSMKKDRILAEGRVGFSLNCFSRIFAASVLGRLKTGPRDGA